MAPKKAPSKPKPAAKAAKPASKPAAKAVSKPKPAPKAAKKAEKPVKKGAKPVKKAAKPVPKKAGQKGQAKTKDGKKRKSRLQQVLHVPRPRNFGIGQDLRPRHDVTRFVRWPQYITVQRQKSVLLKRLKVPPAVNQFRHTLDKFSRRQLFQFIRKYRPESKIAQKLRLKKEALAKAKNPKAPAAPRRPILSHGLQRVTRLIEMKTAKLVIIASDVEPLELVVWMPTLCKKMGVNYCIVKSKGALGKLVGMKKVSCLALTNLRSEDKQEFDKLVESIRVRFHDKFEEANKHWGGLNLGQKHATKMAKRAKARQ